MSVFTCKNILLHQKQSLYDYTYILYYVEQRIICFFAYLFDNHSWRDFHTKLIDNLSVFCVFKFKSYSYRILNIRVESRVVKVWEFNI